MGLAANITPTRRRAASAHPGSPCTAGTSTRAGESTAAVAFPPGVHVCVCEGGRGASGAIARTRLAQLERVRVDHAVRSVWVIWGHGCHCSTACLRCRGRLCAGALSLGVQALQVLAQPRPPRLTARGGEEEEGYTGAGVAARGEGESCAAAPNVPGVPVGRPTLQLLVRLALGAGAGDDTRPHPRVQQRHRALCLQAVLCRGGAERAGPCVSAPTPGCPMTCVQAPCPPCAR